MLLNAYYAAILSPLAQSESGNRDVSFAAAGSSHMRRDLVPDQFLSRLSQATPDGKRRLSGQSLCR
jgi:hypothetical protein